MFECHWCHRWKLANIYEWGSCITSCMSPDFSWDCTNPHVYKPHSIAQEYVSVTMYLQIALVTPVILQRAQYQTLFYSRSFTGLGWWRHSRDFQPCFAEQIFFSRYLSTPPMFLAFCLVSTVPLQEPLTLSGFILKTNLCFWPKHCKNLQIWMCQRSRDSEWKIHAARWDFAKSKFSVRVLLCVKAMLLWVWEWQAIPSANVDTVWG